MAGILNKVYYPCYNGSVLVVIKVKPCFTDTSLLRTVCFVPGERKPFSLNLTRLIPTLFIPPPPPPVSVLTGLTVSCFSASALFPTHENHPEICRQHSLRGSSNLTNISRKAAIGSRFRLPLMILVETCLRIDNYGR